MNTTTKKPGKPVPRHRLRHGRHRTPSPLTRLYAHIWTVLITAAPVMKKEGS